MKALSQLRAIQRRKRAIYISISKSQTVNSEGRTANTATAQREELGVNELLRETDDNFAGWTLDVRGITGRTLTVWAIVKGQWIEKDAGIYRFEFDFKVTTRRIIALTK